MIIIRKVAEDYGWLGNMAPFSVEFAGIKYPTSEALFQCLRFDNEVIREAIRAQKSPMAAKMVAKKHRSQMCILPMSAKDLGNMRMCLKLKVDQNPHLDYRLRDTNEEWIVEDCTKRPGGSGMFWGAAKIGDDWKGENWSGVLWMELRECLKGSLKQ